MGHQREPAPTLVGHRGAGHDLGRQEHQLVRCIRRTIAVTGSSDVHHKHPGTRRRAGLARDRYQLRPIGCPHQVDDPLGIVRSTRSARGWQFEDAPRRLAPIQRREPHRFGVGLVLRPCGRVAVYGPQACRQIRRRPWRDIRHLLLVGRQDDGRRGPVPWQAYSSELCRGRVQPPQLAARPRCSRSSGSIHEQCDLTVVQKARVDQRGARIHRS